MNYILKSLFVLLIVLTFSLHSAAIDNENIHIIPFIKSSGLILVEANFDGNSGFFIFDTGTDAVLVNAEYKDEVSSTNFQSLNGSFSSKEVSIAQLSLGTYSLNGVTAHTADLSKFKILTGKNIIGIVGAKLFNAEILRIDNIKKTLEFLPKKFMTHLRNNINYSCPVRFENDIPIIEVTIDNKHYPFGLDTGSTTSLIDQEFIDSHQDIVKKIDKQFSLVTAVEKSEELECYTVSPIKISKITLQDLTFGTFDFSKMNDLFESPIIGIISVDQLPVKELFLDYADGQLYFLF